jgi:hypothetical protein
MIGESGCTEVSASKGVVFKEGANVLNTLELQNPFFAIFFLKKYEWMLLEDMANGKNGS